MFSQLKYWYLTKMIPIIKRRKKDLRFYLKLTPATVKDLIEQHSFTKMVRDHCHFYFGSETDGRHTIATFLEWAFNYTLWYSYKYMMYITKPFRFVLSWLKQHAFLYLICQIIIAILALDYLVTNFLSFDLVKTVFLQNYVVILSGLIFFSLSLYFIRKNIFIEKLNYYFTEYKNKDLILGLIIWSALFKLSLTNILYYYYQIKSTAFSFFTFISFPFLVLTIFMLFVTSSFYIIRFYNSYIKTKGLTRYEKLIYEGRKYPKSYTLALYILWVITLYIVVFYVNKYFYTYIAIDTFNSFNVVMLYVWLILLFTITLPRIMKACLHLARQTTTSAYNRTSLPTFFLFTAVSYILVFYLNKFYYNAVSLTSFSFSTLTFCIIGLLLAIIFALFFVPATFVNSFKFVSFLTTSFVYFLSLFYWIGFDRSTPKFQFVLDLTYNKFLGIDFILGIDGISLFFVLLTTLISPLLILISWSVEQNVKLLTIILLITELLTLITFMALDLFLFYIVFESILIPLFISILVWGSRRRKIKAAKMLFVYTLISAILFLIALFTFYLELGSTNFLALALYTPQNLSLEKQNFLWILLFTAFSIKVPLYPLHTWLPEAHVEAPTFGSVILASLLLKTGGYGLFRFVLPLFPYSNTYFAPIVFMLALMGVIYAALASIRQIDMKRIIAYLSVSHMNLCVLGQFSQSLEGLMGSLLLMIAHGLIAAGFFISVGFVYERYHTRLIQYYGGLARVMPIFATVLFIFVLANMNMPGTSNFMGELLILIGVGYKGILLALLAAVGSGIGALCTIWFWNRVMFGEIKTQYFGKFEDLNRREFAIVLPLVIFNFAIGIFTNEFADTCYNSIYFLYTFLII